MVACLLCKQKVAGSSPVYSTNKAHAANFKRNLKLSVQFRSRAFAQVAKWLRHKNKYVPCFKRKLYGLSAYTRLLGAL